MCAFASSQVRYTYSSFHLSSAATVRRVARDNALAPVMTEMWNMSTSLVLAYSMPSMSVMELERGPDSSLQRTRSSRAML